MEENTTVNNKDDNGEGIQHLNIEQCYQVSIIVPVYNSSNYLPKCIDSLLNQTAHDYEIILVNDGSTDDSASICEYYSRINKNVFYFYQENQGVSAARNLGIKKAHGKYISFVDSDDWVEVNYLQLLLENMSEGGLSVCKISGNKKHSTCKGAIHRMSPEQAQVSIFTSTGMNGFPFGKLFERKLLIDNNIFFDEEIGMCEDLLFCIQYAKYISGTINFSESTLYHYEQSNDGATLARFKKKGHLHDKMSEFKAVERCEKFLYKSYTVEKNWKYRLVKAAVADLRAMEASQETYSDQYQIRISYIRDNAWLYVLDSAGEMSSKLSVFLSAISPKLEYVIWKIICMKK